LYGEWWIDTRKRPPKNYKPPKHTVAGDLLADGMSDWALETIGSLTAESIGQQRGSPVVETEDDLVTIRGTDSAGKSYSLLGCYDINSIMQSSSVRDGVQRWAVSTIVEGDSTWVDRDSKVEEISISFRDLAAWATDVRNSPYTYDADAHVMSFHGAWNDEESLVQDCPVRLRHGFSWSSSDSRFVADASASITISDTLKLQQVAEKWIRPINELMSLLAMRPSFPIGIGAHLLERFGRERPTEIDIRIPQPLDHVDEDDAEEGIVSQQLKMLVTRVGLQGAGVTFEALVGGWFAVRNDDKLRVAFERLADSQAKTSGFSFDDSLLHACNGLESLHAACFDGSESVDADTKEILTRLQEAVPDSHKELLVPRLATTRNKSFVEKVDEITQSCGDTGRAILEAYSNLVPDINNFRTRAAHANTKPKDATGQIDVLIGSQWLLRHSLLQALGVSTAECDAIILPNFTFKGQLRRLEARHASGTT